METVCGKKLTYPMFLWITGCKILFIVGDNVGKTPQRDRAVVRQANKNPSVIMLLFAGFSLGGNTAKADNPGGYFLYSK